MKVVLGGASGMIGSYLKQLLRERGDEVHALVRPQSNPAPNSIPWDPANGALDADKLEGCDAVVHLGGTNVAEGPWNAKRKKAIRDSRIDSTNLLAQKLAALRSPPKVFVCASAIGIYGDRGDTLLDEDAIPGKGFLEDVAKDWETACAPAIENHIRVVNARIGVVLAKEGGALEKMLMPFKMGVGGRVGSGKQYMSWISLEDVTKALIYCIDQETLSGPVNLVAPEAVTNAAFTKALGSVIHRPTLLPVPRFAIRTIFGEMGDKLLLGSTRVHPKKLLDANFPFQHSTPEDAIRFELSR
jgi:uncharacterized protein (TIGR01777 family)